MQLIYGIPEDIDKWMGLVKQVRYNFPGLETDEKINEHRTTVLKFMGKRQAVCMKEKNEIVGVLLFSIRHNMICFIAVSPDYRRRGVASMLLKEALYNLDRTKEISLSTFRADDEKGTAPRALYEKHGFIEDALVEEFNYPNQRYVLHPIGSERKNRQIAVNKVVREISTRLQGNDASIYLYGSSVLNDFRLGWSYIDILVLTDKQITERQAQTLGEPIQKFADVLEKKLEKYSCIQEKNMILLTAFKGNNNSSKILLDSISSDNIRKKLLTNSFDACEQEIIDAISIFQPKYVISFGRKPVINKLYIEPAACNEGDCIRTNFDISVLEKSFSEHNLAYKVSSKLSNYLCNHAYYCGLRYIEKNTAETKMIFIHIPDMKNIKNMDSVISWLNDFCGGSLQ